MVFSSWLKIVKVASIYLVFTYFRPIYSKKILHHTNPILYLTADKTLGGDGVTSMYNKISRLHLADGFSVLKPNVRNCTFVNNFKTNPSEGLSTH